MTIPTYTAEEIDALALMACETVVAQPGKVTAYDVEAYQRISRDGKVDNPYAGTWHD